ncbi:hypothetical protein [Pseudomonas sp. ABFPK]|uniref:hypothetical protein n=1 Tax=Pseudomonas sp. ABFPK TaxID=1636605 RepID=UPI000778C845|nr:hypothetical protein [Pseudomonas sp. ABFPK]KYC18429.1 SSU ribosomal protein S2p (SAe) [Pseudomonas sp. ABFPK]OII57941.1 SSU ribosomal protein S2p (SAe) [Pseudomonas putida]
MYEARAFINPRMQNYHTLKAGLALGGHAASKFDILNAHIYNSVVRSGELVIVGDWSTPSCTSQEAYLMSQASITHMGLMRSGQGADEFFLDNFELLKSLLAHASLGAGVVSDGWSRHLKAIQDTLLEIEKLHREHLGSGTLKNRDQFYAKRAALFSKLDEQLGKLAAFGSGLRNKGSIKRTLAISTKRYLHTGEVAGYADKVAGVGKAASLIKKGTYIGIALDVAATGLAIRQACMLGREDECTRAKFLNGASLAGGLTGSGIGGYIGGTIVAPFVCAALGVGTAGLGSITCAVIGAAAGGKLGGDFGGEKGEVLGDFLYREFSQ